ncbi:hypothetical protein LOY42_04295 [Pseudomonas sp. B21-023]|uniref:hypothetical protein n=1 Tax=Pseudomonas sp. B21-023 TaxID=2895477 RepID=UPI0021600C3D|nr:hypothetical protein [Pseudomonas sp. B21-023]UVM17538.1 hypothetical protein LOY42_04295 [Pseudomonas sp. B21-023]
MNTDLQNKLFIDGKVRARWILSLTPLVIGGLLKFYVDVPFRFEPTPWVKIAEYAYPILFAAGLFYILYWFLQTGFRDRKILEQDPDALKTHNDRTKLKETIKAQETHINFLNEQLNKSIKFSAITSTPKYIYQKYAHATEDTDSTPRINTIINLTRDASFGRIRREIDRCGFRGAIYLAAGVALAILGILALAGFVFPDAFGVYSKFFNTGPTIGSSDYATAIHYIPKFSFIISIEILAYFFLRLHKSNLVEAKYYQNELTNLEIRYLSLDAALHIERAETSHKVISSLSETERNHILEKGQTTLELKKIELEKNQFIEITKSLASLTPKSK